MVYTHVRVPGPQRSQMEYLRYQDIPHLSSIWILKINLNKQYVYNVYSVHTLFWKKKLVQYAQRDGRSIKLYGHTQRRSDFLIGGGVVFVNKNYRN